METIAQAASPKDVEAVATWAASLVDPIRFLDVGCRGVHPTWRRLAPFLDFVGCDPLAAAEDEQAVDECASKRVYRCAVAPDAGEATLHVAADVDCSSLLEPNRPVVERYGYAWRFEIVEQRRVECTTLDALAAEHGAFDVVKLDSQGLDYELVGSGIGVLSQALAVEVEAGFVESYVGERPLAEIDPLLRGAGLSLVELKPLWSRRRAWSDAPSAHQPLWCETVWLRDLVGAGAAPEPAGVAKLAVICKLLGQFAFGQELLLAAARQGVVPPAVGEAARDPGLWRLPWTLSTGRAAVTLAGPDAENAAATLVEGPSQRAAARDPLQ